MIYRVVVAGCRNYDNYDEAKDFIDRCLSHIRKENEIIIVSGGCSGADMLGERYAKESGFKVERYPANWDKFGKSAGPKRNEEMAKIADFVICFWDNASVGTKSMISLAQRHKKPIKIKRIS